jgi:hypothetical protein
MLNHSPPDATAPFHAHSFLRSLRLFSPAPVSYVPLLRLILSKSLRF